MNKFFLVCGILQNLFNFHFLLFCTTLLSFIMLSGYNVQIEKNVFAVFYSGERAKNKILKICEAFGANRYPFTEDLEKQAQAITEVCITLLFEAVFSIVRL